MTLWYAEENKKDFIVAQFNDALRFVLGNEGRFKDNPADPGGATNFGISWRFLHQLPPQNLRRYGFFDLLTPQTIKDLTQEQVAMIYQGEFWSVAPFAGINSQQLCNYIFDMCVNFGMPQAIKIIQRAITGLPPLPQIFDDGVFGRRTLEAINDKQDYLIKTLPLIRSSFYRALAMSNPKNAQFLKGWLNRAARI